jgi:hypothetical protein
LDSPISYGIETVVSDEETPAFVKAQLAALLLDVEEKQSTPQAYQIQNYSISFHSK